VTVKTVRNLIGAVLIAIGVIGIVGVTTGGDSADSALKASQELTSSPKTIAWLIGGVSLILLGLSSLRMRSAFELFRVVLTSIILVGACWLIVKGVTGAIGYIQVSAAGAELLVPVIQVVVGLLLLLTGVFCLYSASPVRRNLENIFSIPELVQKLLFTLALLGIYRVGFYVPLAGLDQAKLEAFMSGQAGGIWGQAIQTANMFTGGNLSQSTLFGLGIMPYISASIIMQLLTTVLPSLEKLQKEGPAGTKKIQEYTRYLTVGLCLVQATFWMRFMVGNKMLYPEYLQESTLMIQMMGIFGLTAGTVFLMWLGEQIDEYGVGNGISLLIMAGIVSRLPGAIMQVASEGPEALGGSGQIGPLTILLLAGMFVFVVAGAILITQAQRRIPIQQAKHVRGRRVYGGQKQFLPLRINHGGVMPIIFASSLMIFPNVLFNWLSKSLAPSNETLRLFADAFQRGSYVWSLCYVGMIFFFAYFWTTVQFRPKEMAEQLRDHGSFIPGLRPGKRTADYLERVMERITYCGAAFLAVIAVLPMVVSEALGIPWSISAFLGGTGLLIVVSVTLQLVQSIESNLVMRNYGGFLGGSARIKGAYR
jgi:preprotein translocase subunit SecY